MANDQNINGSYLGMPLALWFAIIATLQSLANTAMQQRTHARLELNAKQAAEEHAEVKKELTGIKNEAAANVAVAKQNVEAVKEIPQAAAQAADKLVEAKKND